MYTIITHSMVTYNPNDNDLYEYYDTYEEAGKAYEKASSLLKDDNEEAVETIFVEDPESIDGGIVKMTQTGPGHLASVVLLKMDVKSIQDAKGELRSLGKKAKRIALGIGLAAASIAGGFIGYKIGRERGMNYMAYWTEQLHLQGFLQYIRPDTNEVVNGIDDLVNAGVLGIIDKKGRIVR